MGFEQLPAAFLAGSAPLLWPVSAWKKMRETLVNNNAGWNKNISA
jgi:hypothetical protein